MLTILSWGGIGDTFRNLSYIPHQAMFRRFGFRCKIVYHDYSHKKLEYISFPDAQRIKQLIDRCPSLTWSGEVSTPKGLRRYPVGLLKKIISLTHGNQVQHFPTDFILTEDEQKGLPCFSSKLILGIQPHLSGMKTKQWGIQNWKKYINGLLSAFRDINIFLFDTDPSVHELCFDPRIQHSLNLNIAQSSTLIKAMSAMISVDSWTKFPAMWNRVPHIIIVPNQQVEFPWLNPEKVVSQDFLGIINHPNNKIIGLSNRGKPHYTLDKISDLSVDFLHASTLELLSGIKTS
jgi:hypothetical protein